MPRDTLQGINISHLGKRKIIFKMPFLGDMLVPWRVFIFTCLFSTPLKFLPSTLRQRFQAQSYVDTVFGGTPPSTITNAAGLPGGFGKPKGGELRMVLETPRMDNYLEFKSGEKPILPDEVTQKSPKTTCVVVFWW